MSANIGKASLLGVIPLLALAIVVLAPATDAQAVGGQAMGWGYNYSGQVGDGTTDQSGGCYCVATPTPVSVPADVTQIDGGYEHGLALRADGTVMSWGYNSRGQLGDGTATDRPAPATVPGLSNVIAVSAADEGSLALLADGTLRAWGGNQQGALGIGTATGPEICSASECSSVPIPVPGVSNVVAIASGEEFHLALLADGTVLAWGNDANGTLGDGVGVAAGCKCVPTPTPVPGLSGVVAISAGDYNGAALLADGTVRNWGLNEQNELGTGVASTEGTCNCLGPVSPAGLAGVRELALGGGHGLAVLDSGAVRAWGYNRYGEIGNGEFSVGGCECVPTPVAVNVPVPAAVTAGTQHSMELLAGGNGLSWGEGTFGQLANGGIVSVNTPGPVAISGASELSAIEYGGFAIVGPSQTLNTAFAGAGSGRVSGKGVLCPPTCSAAKPQGQVAILRAEPSPGSGFAGFSGPCAGTGTCSARMDSDLTVTATFGPPQGTAITRAVVKSRKKRASFSFSAPGAITGYQCKLNRPRPKPRKRRKGKPHALRKGKKQKPRFSGCAAPKVYKHLRPGRYTFRVRALDILGADATPATKRFRVKPVKHGSSARSTAAPPSGPVDFPPDERPAGDRPERADRLVGGRLLGAVPRFRRDRGPAGRVLRPTAPAHPGR